MTDRKCCTKCAVAKSLDEFPRSRRTKDGHTSWCKKCHRDAERARRQRDPEAARRKDRERYIAGRHGSDYARKWRQENPEASRASGRRSYERNRDKRLVEMREQRLKRHGRTPETVNYIKAILGDPCSYCGERIVVDLDHIEPKSKGGADEWENFTPACRSCNAAKADRPLLLFLALRNGCYEWRRDIPAAA